MFALTIQILVMVFQNSCFWNDFETSQKRRLRAVDFLALKPRYGFLMVSTFSSESNSCSIVVGFQTILLSGSWGVNRADVSLTLIDTQKITTIIILIDK